MNDRIKPGIDMNGPTSGITSALYIPRLIGEITLPSAIPVAIQRQRFNRRAEM
jgi:hypothetical protein